MVLRDIRYLLSFIIPVTCFISLSSSGWWSWITLVVAFVIVPIIETIIDTDNENLVLDNDEQRNNSIYFKLLLFLNLPIVYVLLYLYFITISNEIPFVDLIGKSLSVGVLLGANAINVAHELGHKNGLIYHWSAKLLLLPCLYTYFTLQHNRGHHLNVGTPIDPATAKYNESIYRFWLRCVPQTFMQAFKLENDRLKRDNKNLFSLQNEMILNIGLHIMYLILVGYFFQIEVIFFSIFIALVSILLLETINYVEHYGLTRNLLANGRYEKVELMHSWNSNHVLGRMMLFELTRHADHHYKANKNYQMLKHYDESPQLPYGYPACMLISLIPALWFKIINPKIKSATI